MIALLRTRPLLAAAGLFAILAAGSAAWAQDETVYIGGHGSIGGNASAGARNSVQVDMSVLDEIGGRPPISQSLLPPPGGSLNGQRVTLSPPGSATARKPQAPRRAAPAAKPAAPRKTSAPASKPTASASAAAPSAPPIPALTEPPPAQIDLATAMPAPLPDPKPVPSAVRAPEPARAGAPRDLKPAPSPTPVLATVAAEPSAPTPSPARAPEPAPAPVSTPAAVAPAAVMADAAVTPAPAQVAALSPPARQTGVGPQSLRIPFSGEAAVLPEPAKGDLKQIAGSLSKDPAMRVQVMAYASGSDDGGKARRLSLSRALAVRTYLIEQGIGSTRIDVRALGNTAEGGGPSDRVDLVVVSR
jgi:outer membrane protein OmpA-like peptidoglycan-associated protein